MSSSRHVCLDPLLRPSSSTCTTQFCPRCFCDSFFLLCPVFVYIPPSSTFITFSFPCCSHISKPLSTHLVLSVSKSCLRRPHLLSSRLLRSSPERWPVAVAVRLPLVLEMVSAASISMSPMCQFNRRALFLPFPVLFAFDLDIAPYLAWTASDPLTKITATMRSFSSPARRRLRRKLTPVSCLTLLTASNGFTNCLP